MKVVGEDSLVSHATRVCHSAVALVALVILAAAARAQDKSFYSVGFLLNVACELLGQYELLANSPNRVGLSTPQSLILSTTR